jgi:isoquinoline 1-oxidoreductase alpha subunit
MHLIQLLINGRPHNLDVPSDMPLLWAIRDHVGLTGTKFGCGQALCGACTVHVDGNPIRSCQTTVADIGKANITTIEGVIGRIADAVRSAWLNLAVPQCGYCQSGQIMSAIALLTTTPTPTDQQINDAMEGNICRCGTYQRIRAAIHQAASTISK